MTSFIKLIQKFATIAVKIAVVILVTIMIGFKSNNYVK